jgi:hypothetical protein
MNGTDKSPYFNALSFISECCGEPQERALPRLEKVENGPKGSVGEAVSATSRARVGEVRRRLPSVEQMEPLFGRLRGADLILATLAYGLGVRVSDLHTVRVRDVNLSAKCIVIAGTLYSLPAALTDDIRDFIHERLCGSEASVTVSRREQRIFSEQDFESFFAQVARYQLEAGQAGVLTERCLNRIFRLLGRFHARKASKRGAKVASPLDLFDKGPRIVRRGRWGVIDAYYLWRTVWAPA